MARPDLLGLPAGATSFSAAATPWAALRDALLAGDEERALESIFSAFLDGDPLAEIADGLISPAMEHLGTLWAHSPDGILVEHRAFDIVMRALRRIQDLLPRPAPGAPVAVGGAPPGDVYTMPSLCASLVFQEAGFRAINLGAQTPWETLILACRQYGPRAVWLSFSTERENGEDTIASLRRLAREGRKSGAIVYCGGAAMPEAIEKMKPENIQPLRRLAELESHLKSGGEPRERSRV
ncbi:MAG: B12-binding domain-containing protein [Sumerlaeia bacterium]